MGEPTADALEFAQFFLTEREEKTAAYHIWHRLWLRREDEGQWDVFGCPEPSHDGVEHIYMDTVYPDRFASARQLANYLKRLDFLAVEVDPPEDAEMLGVYRTENEGREELEEIAKETRSPLDHDKTYR